MGRHSLQTLAWILMWVGTIVLVACLLSRFWFQLVIPYMPVSLVTLGIGFGLFLVARRLN